MTTELEELDSSFEEGKLNFNIPILEEECLIEDYLKNDYSFNTPMVGMEIPSSNYFISELQESPDLFLNFGMKTADFKIYLLKHLYMRVERTLIQKGIESFKEKKLRK